MKLERKHKITLVLIGVVVALIVPIGFVYAEDFLNSFYSPQGEVHYNASDGPEVIVEGYSVQSGNPFTDKSFNLSTENSGWVNISTEDADSSHMVLKVEQINGSFTNVSNVEAVSGSITIDPDDKNESTIEGNFTSYRFTDNISPDDGETDFFYDGDDGEVVSVEVRGDLENNVQYGAVDEASGLALDLGVADSNGNVEFSELEASSHNIQIQEFTNLSVRNETEPHGLITDCTVNLKFYESVDDDPIIAEVQDSDQDGKINITGLPVDTRFVANSKCDGWTDRQVVIPNIAEQENIFLLDNSVENASIIFEVDDRTGLFGTRSTLIVQRAINKSEWDGSNDNQFEWTNIEGDELGARSGIDATLEVGERYRLVIQNQDGEERIIGTYTPTVSTVEDIIVGRIEWPALNGTAQLFTASIEDESQLGNDPPVIQIAYQDNQSTTTGFNYSVFEQGNRSNQIDSGSSSQTLGNFYAESNITDNQSNTNWIIEVEYSLDGESITEQRLVGEAGLTFADGLPWIQDLALIGVTLVGLLYGRRTVNVGIVLMWMLAGILLMFEMINISPAWYIISGLIIGAALLRTEVF